MSMMEELTTTTISRSRYKELLKAEVLLEIIEDVYASNDYVSENTIRMITGWKKPIERDLDVISMAAGDPEDDA